MENPDDPILELRLAPEGTALEPLALRNAIVQLIAPLHRVGT